MDYYISAIEEKKAELDKEIEKHNKRKRKHRKHSHSKT